MASSAGSEPSGLPVDEATRKRLARMEVVTSLEAGGGLKRAVATALIDAPPGRVWRVIGDFDAYAEFMPQTIASEVLERTDDGVRFKTTLEFPIKQVWYVLRIHMDRAALRTWWEMEDGSIAANEGSWELQEWEPGRTLARYSLRIDPGFPVPGFLLSRATKGTLPLVIEAVRKRVTDPRYDDEGQG